MRKRRERRHHRRLKQKERLFIRIMEAGEAPELKGRTIYCSSVDVSAGGLQIESDHAAPAGCLLDMWVEVKGRRGRLFLTGEVRWSRPVEPPGRYLLGIELKAGDATEEVDWAELFGAAAGSP